MTTKMDAQAPAAKEEKNPSTHAVLFLLEGLAGVGQKAAFDVLKSILGEQGLKDGTVEIQWRDKRPPRMAPIAEAPSVVAAVFQ